MKKCSKCGNHDVEFPPKGVQCRVCIREYMSAYRNKNKATLFARKKAWADANPNKVRESRNKSVAANPERTKESKDKYAQKNKAKIAVKRSEYKKNNKEKIAISSKLYREKNLDACTKREREYRKKNPEIYREKGRRFQKNNPSKIVAYCAKYNASKRNAMPAWANAFFIEGAYRLAKLRTKMLGNKWEVDHIVPLQSKFVSGLHCEANLQVIPSTLNKSKSNRYWPDMP